MFVILSQDGADEVRSHGITIYSSILVKSVNTVNS
jgi:hypothetical protein